MELSKENRKLQRKLNRSKLTRKKVEQLLDSKRTIRYLGKRLNNQDISFDEGW